MSIAFFSKEYHNLLHKLVLFIELEDKLRKNRENNHMKWVEGNNEYKIFIVFDCNVWLLNCKYLYKLMRQNFQSSKDP